MTERSASSTSGRRHSRCRALAAGLAGALAAGCLAIAATATAAEIPVTPILRIETGMHDASINGIAADRATQQVITVSDDKTLRVWAAADGQLLATARGPIGDGPEGALYAAALSPSGKTVAVGGYTGIAWDRSAAVYLFARDDGHWLGRITFGNIRTDTINHIAFSPDGRYLAVGANDTKGLRVVDTVGRSVSVVDADYGDAIEWLDFAPDGRLVTSALDGAVRLYDAAFKRQALHRVAGGHKPLAAAFNPDGSSVAVGLVESGSVLILSGRDLTPQGEYKGAADRRGGLSVVAWSSDGKTLYAGGTYGDGRGKKFVRKWPSGGQGSDIAVGDDTVTGLAALDGSVVFATAEPAWGRLAADGTIAVRRGRPHADFRDGYTHGFNVSADGAIVEFGFAQGGARRARFDMLTGSIELNPQTRADVKPPATAAGGSQVTDWRNGETPKVNGTATRLDANERSRSAAVHGADAVIGTDYFLRGYKDGRPAWRTAVASPAWVVNVTGNGGLAVAGLGDGTIRWYRMTDGAEVMSLFAAQDGKQWVLWTPEGFFDYGGTGQTLIGYHLNQVGDGRLKGATLVNIDQVFALFFRRDLVVKKFRGSDGAAIASELQKIGDVRTVLGRGLPPEIKLTEYCLRQGGKIDCQPVAAENRLRGVGGKIQPVTVAAPEVVLRFEVEDRGGGVGPIVVRRQGATVAADGGTRSVSGHLHNEERVVPLQPGLNLLNLSAFNSAKEIEVDQQDRPGLVVRYQPPVVELATLRLFAIGINNFKSSEVPKLANAAADARGVAEVMEKNKKRNVFGDVDAIVLTDQQATLDAIGRAFDDLARRSKPGDLALIFLAGHGVDLDGKYYFLPYDLPDLAPETIRTKSLTHDAFAGYLSKFPTARTVVVLDTCYSGAFAVDDSILRDARDQTLGKQISHATGRFILAGSASQEEALDGVAGHGVFTDVLLRGLAGDADTKPPGNHDGRVNIYELGEFTKGQVADEAAKVGHGRSQRPRWFFNGDDMFNVRDVD